jgi:hypothetical protein
LRILHVDHSIHTAVEGKDFTETEAIIEASGATIVPKRALDHNMEASVSQRRLPMVVVGLSESVIDPRSTSQGRKTHGTLGDLEGRTITADLL